jgi:tight adherence protein B
MDIFVFVGLLVLILGLTWPFVLIHQAQFSKTEAVRRRTLALAREGRADSADSAARARQRLIQGKLREMEKQRSKRRGTLSHLIKQSGLSLTMSTYIAMCAGGGVATFLILFSLKMSLLVCVLGAVGATIALPRFVLKQIIGSRQKQFTHFFADGLDILVRGARTGLPVGECLRIVGREVPDPVGYEFRMLVECQRVGMTTDQALERGLERMPTADFQFFAVVLVIQQQTGGNLAATLENLAGILRARKRLKDKVAAMSSEAKASAMIIGSLPFMVGSMIYLVNPSYIGLLFSTHLGNILISGGLFWMATGIIVMHQMINFKL